MAESRHDKKHSEQDIEQAGQSATKKGEESVANNGETVGPSSANKDESPLRSSQDGQGVDNQPNMHNKRLGRLGEDVAARYLVSRGYEIIARNWTCQAGEADIIARDDDILVFAEVKTRSSTEKGFPSEAVDSKKRGKYLKIAELFASRYDVQDLQVRFDVMSLVVTDNAHATIRHYINAFGAESV